jgi:peptidoglycan-associated lipoprotein
MKFLLLFFVFIFQLFSQPLKEVSDSIFEYPLNTQNAEYNPVISPNSRYIVFQSNRPGGEGGMDIWLSENQNYRDRMGKPRWSDPVNFRELNTPGYEGAFSIRFDVTGNPVEIFFTSAKTTDSKRDGFAGLNIYSTQKNPATGKWKVPEHLNIVNSNFDDKMPAISPDGRVLVFSSNRPGGFGGFDLWVSYRDLALNTWSEPVNLGEKINTASNEIMPYYHYDGLSIFFSSDRGNENFKFSFYVANFLNADFMVQTLENANKEEQPYYSSKNPLDFQEVFKLGRPFNSEADDEGLSLSHDGLWVYYSSNRLGGMGQFDIYRSILPEELRRYYPILFHGLVMDGSEDAMIGLDSTLKIYNEKGVVKTITSKRSGGELRAVNSENFRTMLSTGSLYRVEVSSPGFEPTEVKLDLRGNVERNKSKYVKIVLLPVKPIPKESETVDVTKKEPPSDQKKPKELYIIVKDYKTKKQIDTSKVILFTEEKKDGVVLAKKKTKYLLGEFPSKDFEILTKTPGYQDTTLTVSVNDDKFKKDEDIVIYTRRLKDIAKIYNTILFFKFNEHKVEDSHKEQLVPLIAHLKNNAKDSIEIAGHTDNVASKQFNTYLSQKRADEIKKYLVEQGISPERLKTKAYWYSQPIGDNKTEDGRAKNRRVDFKKAN